MELEGNFVVIEIDVVVVEDDVGAVDGDVVGEVEDEVVGPHADRVRQKVSEVASTEVEKAKAVASAVVDVWLHEREALRLDRNAPLLCTLAGGRVSDAYVRKLLATLAERAGVSPFTTRTLRFTLVDVTGADREDPPGEE